MNHIYLCLIAIFSTIATLSYADSNVPQKEPQSFLAPTMQQTCPPVEKKEQTLTPVPHTSQESMQEPHHMPTYGGAVTKMVLTLAGLISMVFITIWLLKKLTQGRIGAFGKKQINILERRPLSPKTVLYVIEFAGKQMIVAESQLEIKALASIDAIEQDR
jgi:flagellar biogenesis protein FliO